MITEENLRAAVYVFLLMGAIIAVSGVLIAYLDKKTKLEERRKKKRGTK